MCKPSTILKLCSCEFPEKNKKDYWELKTDLQGELSIQMGLVRPPENKASDKRA